MVFTIDYCPPTIETTTSPSQPRLGSFGTAGPDQYPEKGHPQEKQMDINFARSFITYWQRSSLKYPRVPRARVWGHQAMLIQAFCDLSHWWRSSHTAGSQHAAEYLERSSQYIAVTRIRYIHVVCCFACYKLHVCTRPSGFCLVFSKWTKTNTL